jgi:hypothetical protein
MIAISLCVILAFCTQPWVALDPIDRFTYLNVKARSMIPQVFTVGESRSSAEGRLAASGYDHSPIDPSVYDDGESCGDLACERARDGFTDFYRKNEVTWNIACTNHFVLWLKFDARDELEAAINGVYGTCL